MAPKTEAPKTGEIIFSISGLTKSFGGLIALNQISFQAKAGEILALIGPNGAGKTSLLNCVSGVYEPEVGSITFKGHEMVGLAPHHVARLGVARTFQNLALFSNLSVVDSLMLGRHTMMRTDIFSAILWFGRAQTEERTHRKRCAEFVELLELTPYAKKPVGLLPYGIQKQIELGRALAAEPQVLLLDEPVSGLNSAETAKMGEILLRVNKELGITMLLVEHDMALVRKVADRVVAMNFGEVIAEGSPEEVSSHPSVIEAYLGVGE